MARYQSGFASHSFAQTCDAAACAAIEQRAAEWSAMDAVGDHGVQGSPIAAAVRNPGGPL
jgi:hypothetical protein